MRSFPCPACKGDAVKCRCGALSLEEQGRLIDSLQCEFINIDHAMDVVCETVDDDNILHAAAMSYIFTNAPEGVRNILRKAFDKVFPVQADYRGPNGERLYSMGLAAKIFGCTVDEMHERANALLPPQDIVHDADDIARVQ